MTLYFHQTPEKLLEQMLFFSNVILKITNDSYRFPSRFCTLAKNKVFASTFYDGFTSFTVCSNCHKIHNPQMPSFSCCSLPLYKQPSSVNRQPFKVFPYNSLITTLKKFFLRPGFVQKLVNGGTDIPFLVTFLTSTMVPSSKTSNFSPLTLFPSLLNPFTI